MNFLYPGYPVKFINNPISNFNEKEEEYSSIQLWNAYLMKRNK